MKSLRLLPLQLLCSVALLTFGSPAKAADTEVNLVMDVRPGTILLSRDAGTFKVRGPDTSNLGTLTLVEEAGSISTLPNLKLGVGLEREKSLTDITGGIGVLVNDRFRMVVLSVDGSYLYKYRKNVALGPHLGLAFFGDAEWSGDAEVEFSDSQGIMGGLQMALGYDILFIVNIDYLLAQPFDITTLNGWRASEDEIDISGLCLQFGMRGRF